MKKFDVVVGNPPYKNGLHMECFNIGVELLIDNGHIIMVHPSTPFILRKPTKKRNSLKTIVKTATDYKTQITLLNGKKLFGVGLWVPASITYIQKKLDKQIHITYAHIDDDTKICKTYESFDNVFLHANDLVLTIRDKVFGKMKDSIEDHLYRRGGRGILYYRLNRISGSKPNGYRTFPDFFQLICKKNENDPSPLLSNTAVGFDDKGGKMNEVALEDSTHIKNFHQYVLTKFARFCVSLYKIAQYLHRGELRAVPWMDFNRSWTDEQLFDHFGLTTEERDYIQKFIQDLYKRDSENSES